jgi:RNA polymerase sigma-54 factor
MRFETSQHMKLGQQMKLAPRMIQSMEILQMPLAELEERIEQELESNPTLELQDQGPEEQFDEEPDRAPEGDTGESADDFERLDDFEESNPEAAENAFSESGLESDSAFASRPDGTDRRARDTGERDAKTDAMASISARGPSMREQLLDQWRLVDVDERLRPVGAMIIESLDDDGYLRVPLAEVGAEEASPPDTPSLEMALEAVQMLLEPPGVAARDARECLLLQIDAQADRPAEARVADSEDLALARVIAEKGLDELAKNRLPKIAQATGLELEQIKRGVETLRRFSLAPGRALSTEGAEPIIPDAIVEYDDEEDRYIAYLSDSRASSLQINREYAAMAKDRAAPKRDREFLKKNLSNAQWLLDAVEQRRSTLLRVIRVVIDEQRDFFDYGPEALRPLPMTQVAEQLGIHVATVSRAVADKHLQTPRGVVPLRGFFTGGLATESGEEVSANAVRAALQEILDNEDKSKPLSDEALSKALKERGYDIARRTVAKYRGQMDVPSARMRKQF